MQWVLIGAVVWAVLCFLAWALIYGGSKNEPRHYEEGYYDDDKTKKG